MGQIFVNYLYPFDTRAVELFVNTPLYVKCEYFMNKKRVEGLGGGGWEWNLCSISKDNSILYEGALICP